MHFITNLHVISDLGAGAFGVVKLCQHDVHKDVAAKFFFRSDFLSEDEWTAACSRALAEGQALKALEHRNVVKILDVVKSPDESEFVIVMEFCTLGSVGKICASNVINLPSIRKIIRDSAIGLCFIHNKGYLHRDIKPDNILLNGEDEAKVGDFGFVTDKLVHGLATPYGTPVYLAPEMWTTGASSVLTDVYSFGVTFLHAIHGDTWFLREGNGKLLATDDNGNPCLAERGLLLPHIPDAWARCIRRLTRREPERRCQSMDEASNLISRLPSVENWSCEVEEEQVNWSTLKAGRRICVTWDKFLRKGSSWRAWSEPEHGGGRPRTLGAGLKTDTWQESYRNLQLFFASRRP